MTTKRKVAALSQTRKSQTSSSSAKEKRPVAALSKQKAKPTSARRSAAVASGKRQLVVTQKKKAVEESDNEPESEEEPVQLSQKARGKQPAIPEEEEESEEEETREAEDDVLPVVQRKNKSPEGQVAEDQNEVMADAGIRGLEKAIVHETIRQKAGVKDDAVKVELPKSATEDLSAVTISKEAQTDVGNMKELPTAHIARLHQASTLPSITVLGTEDDQQLGIGSSKSADARDRDEAEALLNSVERAELEEVNELASGDAS
jgi:uncharacterized protein YciI